MNNDNPLKSLVYLAGAGVLGLLGILIFLKIVSVTIALITGLIPFALVAGGIYLGYKWWRHKSLTSGERRDRWS